MRNGRLAGVSIVTGVVFLLFAGSAAAQERSGGWFGAGGGWGTADVSCDDCDGGDSDRESSGVFYVNGGFAVSDRVLVGAEANFWMKSFSGDEFLGDASVNLYNILGTVTLYPSPGGFFVKGGAGVGFADIDFDEASVSVDMGSGFAWSVGAGYDIALGKVALTPAVNYWAASTGDLKLLGEPILTGLTHNVFTVTIGVKFP